MPQIVPIKNLRDTTKISELCHSKEEPIFITKNGYGDLVVMSIDTYDKMIGEKDIDNSIMEAEAEILEGKPLINAKSALNELKEKHFG